MWAKLRKRVIRSPGCSCRICLSQVTYVRLTDIIHLRVGCFIQLNSTRDEEVGQPFSMSKCQVARRCFIRTSVLTPILSAATSWVKVSDCQGNRICDMSRVDLERVRKNETRVTSDSPFSFHTPRRLGTAALACIIRRASVKGCIAASSASTSVQEGRTPWSPPKWGEAVGFGEDRSDNPLVVGYDGLAHVVREATAEAVATAGIARDGIDGTSFDIDGQDWPSQHPALLKSTEASSLNAPVWR